MKPSLAAVLMVMLLAVANAAAKDDITKELITSNGKTRAYYLYVPSTVKADAPAPLVVMLHGSGRVGNSLVEKWKDLPDAGRPDRARYLSPNKRSILHTLSAIESRAGALEFLPRSEEAS